MSVILAGSFKVTHQMSTLSMTRSSSGRDSVRRSIKKYQPSSYSRCDRAWKPRSDNGPWWSPGSRPSERGSRPGSRFPDSYFEESGRNPSWGEEKRRKRSTNWVDKKILNFSKFLIFSSFRHSLVELSTFKVFAHQNYGNKFEFPQHNNLSKNIRISYISL